MVGELGYPGSRAVEELTARILAPATGPEESFVLLEQDKPVETANIAHDDLASRRDLTPWLAGVYVKPAYRGHGFASLLVRQGEAFALAASEPTLWLYTWTAESLYTRLGWQRVGLETNRGEEVVLMSRRLTDRSDHARHRQAEIIFSEKLRSLTVAAVRVSALLSALQSRGLDGR
jgi:GNAT superfamily N-acetyltransferase